MIFTARCETRDGTTFWRKRRWTPPWNTAITIWWPWRSSPRFYVPTSWTDPQTVARNIRHELVHVGQWKRLGRIRFLWRYLRASGRRDLEAEAYAESIRYWIGEGCDRNVLLEDYVLHHRQGGDTEAWRAALVKYLDL